MGDLTRNLSRKEFRCKCGLSACKSEYSIDYLLIKVVQDAADFFALKRNLKRSKVIILSGNRCKIWNAFVWGKKICQSKKKLSPAFFSYHTKNMASDFYIFGVSPKELYNYLDKSYPNKFGIGLYHNRVHLDTRKHKARWSDL